MKNLLKETLAIMEENAITELDILWCGNKEYFFSWEEFKRISNIEYDNGYGSAKIATDLIIVGKNFWLERGEYDGSEWWEYKTTPKKPKNKLDVKALTIEQAEANGLDVSCGWESLKSLNIKENL